ncbi:MAG: hypothetical protein A4E66_02715 [Syntrophus sp. PtaB.Bin001]|nr:MAG: hypothetical protein A4E66_02715 [Syntrophus sp. PtaB.Bin001]
MGTRQGLQGSSIALHNCRRNLTATVMGIDVVRLGYSHRSRRSCCKFAGFDRPSSNRRRNSINFLCRTGDFTGFCRDYWYRGRVINDGQISRCRRLIFNRNGISMGTRQGLQGSSITLNDCCRDVAVTIIGIDIVRLSYCSRCRQDRSKVADRNRSGVNRCCNGINRCRGSGNRSYSCRIYRFCGLAIDSCQVGRSNRGIGYRNRIGIVGTGQFLQVNDSVGDRGGDHTRCLCIDDV